MDVNLRIKQIVLLLGDIVLLYISLLSALWMRQQFELRYELLVTQHIEPFTLLFIVWIFVFYIAGLYEPRLLKNDLDFFSMGTKIIGVTTRPFVYLCPCFYNKLRKSDGGFLT